MKKYHIIEKIEFVKNKMIIKVDGSEYTFELSEISQKLYKASKIERERYKISPSGYGIHWPLLDKDLSIDGLLGIKHRPLKAKATIDN